MQVYGFWFEFYIKYSFLLVNILIEEENEVTHVECPNFNPKFSLTKM